MRDGFQVMDVDRHVMEPLSMWQEYLPVGMREYAPRLTPLLTRSETMAQRVARLGEYALLPPPLVLSVGGEPLMRNVSDAATIETGLVGEQRRALLASAETARGHLTEMDATGVDVAVLLPTFAPFLVYNDAINAERSRAYAHAYNRWLKELTAEAPERLWGAALLSRHDPEAMVLDLEQALADGTRAIALRPNPVRGLMLSAPQYRRFWQACEHHSITVLLHEGTHTRVNTAGADRFQSHFGQHACSHPMEAMMALLALIEGGTLEEHPGLRIGFLESGCGWLPYWLWRLDQMEYAQLKGEVRKQVKIAPSEYFKRQCWIALEPREALLPEVLKSISPERVVFGTDFPHLDHGPGIVDDVFEQRAAIGDAGLRSVLWESACALMGVSPFALNHL